jgi:hypothetical protein
MYICSGSAAQRGGACAVRNNKLDRIKQSSGTGTSWSRFRADILNGRDQGHEKRTYNQVFSVHILVLTSLAISDPPKLEAGATDQVFKAKLKL